MRRFTLAQIDALLEIERTGSFHGAAQSLNVTQPSISLRIRELEAAMGVELFDRGKRNATPTTDGLVAIRYAREAVALLDELGVRLAGSQALRGVLRLGASEMLAMTCLPDVVTEIESRFPALRIELTVENSNALHAQIAADKLDLAFLSRPSVGVDVRLQPIASAPVAWLGASAKRLSVARLRPADLDGKTILSLPPGSPLYSMVAAWCAPAEVLPARRFSTCNSTAVIAGLVASGVAMSVLPLPVLARAIDQGDVVAYGQDEPFKRLSVCAAFSRTIRPGQFDSVVELVAEIIRRHRYFGPAEQH